MSDRRLTAKQTEVLFDKIVVPKIDFDNLPIEVALEFIRIKILDYVQQTEDKSDDVYVDFVNRSMHRWKKVTLRGSNLKISEILNRLAKENRIRVVVEDGRVVVYDSKNTAKN